MDLASICARLNVDLASTGCIFSVVLVGWSWTTKLSGDAHSSLTVGSVVDENDHQSILLKITATIFFHCSYIVGNW